MKRGALRVAAALALGLSLIPEPSQALWPFSRRELPDPRQDLGAAAAALLARTIRIPTVNPPGNERPVAELLYRVARDLGLEARLVPTPASGASEGRAAVWARVPGTGQRPAVLLLSHLDVVPAEPESWAVNPFAGVVAGGTVVGRGALDAKGVAVVQLLALAELARRDEPLARDVLFLATPDEESGGIDGAGYLVRRHPELLYGAEYLLTEGGGILEGPGGGANVWGVAVAEKSPCWVRLTALGAPGHAATPGPGDAVSRLLEALDRVRGIPRPIRVVPEVARMFARLAPRAAEADRTGFADLARALAEDEAFRKRFLSDPARAALVHDTLAITVLRGAARTNVIPGRAWAELDARLLPGRTCEAFLGEVAHAVRDPHVHLEPFLSFASLASPAESELFAAIETVAGEVDPGALVVPRLIAGFTDAHYFRELGIVAYGFVPRWLPPSETRGIHGPNERISIRNLERGVRTLARILEVLGAP